MNALCVTLLIVNLAWRLLFSQYVCFGDDENAIYQIGLAFYETLKLPATGPAVVYSGTHLPGSLQALLAGLPLFLTGGHPWGVALGIAVIQFLALGITFLAFRRLFPKVRPELLILGIFYAPWTYLYTNPWNPSYLPFFCALFLWGLVRLEGSSAKGPPSFWASAAVGFALLATPQLHLSFVLLWIFFAWAIVTRGPRFFRWAGVFAGAGFGGLTLIPFFMTLGSSGGHAFLSRNIVFHPEAFGDVLKTWLRFLTFPTGETTRFFAQNQGLQGVLAFLSEHPWLWPLFVLGMIGSLGIFLLGVRFYLRKSNWPWRHSDLARQLAWGAPWVAGVLFFFSIKAVSAHTIWILLPLSFLPACYEGFSRVGRPGKTPKTLWRVAIVVYLVCVNIVSIVGYRWAYPNVVKTAPSGVRSGESKS